MVFGFNDVEGDPRSAFVFIAFHLLRVSSNSLLLSATSLEVVGLPWHDNLYTNLRILYAGKTSQFMLPLLSVLLVASGMHGKVTRENERRSVATGFSMLFLTLSINPLEQEFVTHCDSVVSLSASSILIRSFSWLLSIISKSQLSDTGTGPHSRVASNQLTSYRIHNSKHAYTHIAS